MQLDLAVLKQCLSENQDVLAAYLFGSAAKGEQAVNDLDILVLLRPGVQRHDAYFDLGQSLSKALGISEDKIDLAFFNLDETDPMVLYNAVNQGVFLKNNAPDILGESIG